MCMDCWPNQPECSATISHLKGKSFEVRLFRSCGFEILLYLHLLLAFASSGFCDDLHMVSVPLGFEISGSDESNNWVSQNGVFAFGYFESCHGDGLVVGVRYNLGSKDANVPVWAVGGGIRVSQNSTLKLFADGRLVLFDNPNGLAVWSSNSSGLGVTKATLLDNGNLVLLGSANEILWQSFNSPTSTLLPGQSFHFPQTLRAPSTMSVSSYYSLVIRRSGELALVWEANVTYWKSQLGSSVDIKEARFDSNGVFGLYGTASANASVWSISSEDFRDPSITLRRLRIDPDGNLRIYSWDNELRTWRIGWQAVENQCDVFGSCGLYSVCGFNSTGPVCSCLYEGSFGQNSGVPWMGSGTFGCKKMVDLANCKMPTSMMVLKHTVLYGLYPSHDIDIMLNEEACRMYCANDTSCVAVTSKNDGSGICTIKTTSFISGYSNPSVASISYMKVCMVPQAVSARNAGGSGSGSTTEALISQTKNGELFRALAWVGIVTAFASLIMQIFAFTFVYGRRKLKDLEVPFDGDAELERNRSAIIRLSFEEIKELTNNFTTQLGQSIFKGTLPNGTPIIAKVLQDVCVPEKSFRATVSILGGTYHRNVAALKGFCYDPKHKVVVYEHISNGSLEKWLVNEGHWQKRLDIALGIAKGLAYLHTECQTCIAHGNLKLGNVMLDEKLTPKLMDFGLQSLLSSSTAELPFEEDIYRLGEILLQIVSGSGSISEIGEMVKGVMERHKLEGEEEEEERAERVVKIGVWCMQKQPFLRPSIGEVVKVLEGTLSVDKPPPPSSFGVREEGDLSVGEIEQVE